MTNEERKQIRNRNRKVRQVHDTMTTFTDYTSLPAKRGFTRTARGGERNPEYVGRTARD